MSIKKYPARSLCNDIEKISPRKVALNIPSLEEGAGKGEVGLLERGIIKRKSSLALISKSAAKNIANIKLSISYCFTDILVCFN